MSVPKTAPYMTVIQDRAPRNKPHLTFGEAKKAVLYRLNGRDELSVMCSVFKWTDGVGWERMWRIDAGTPREALPWV